MKLSSRAKRKMNTLPMHMKIALSEYKKSGRVAFVYPFKGQISLNGARPISYHAAYLKMSECNKQEMKIK